jgi:hypothetical protein
MTAWAMNLGNDHKRARAAYGMFEGIADQPVPQREDQDQHEHANHAANPSFPNQEYSGEQQQRAEDGIAAYERHDHVANRIDQPQVDEPE